MANIPPDILTGVGNGPTTTNSPTPDEHIRHSTEDAADASLLLQLSCSDLSFTENTQVNHTAVPLPQSQEDQTASMISDGGEPLSLNQNHTEPNDNDQPLKRVRSAPQLRYTQEDGDGSSPIKRQKTEIKVESSPKKLIPTAVTDGSTLRTIEQMEEELKYTQSDLLHEKARWNHFRLKAKKLGIWNILLLGPEADSNNTTLTTLPKSNEPILEVQTPSVIVGQQQHQQQQHQVEQLLEDLAEQTTRREAVENENQKLIAELDQLRVKMVMEQATKPVALTQDQVFEHPLYKALYSGYLHERALNAKLSQLSESLKQELKASSEAQNTTSAKLEDAERKRRNTIEALLHEKESIILEKDREIREHGHKLRVLESLQTQLQTEQQKVKEYSVLVGTLRRDLDKLRRVKKSQQKDDDLSQEFDNVQRAYDSMAEQNSRLLQTLDERERATTQLRSEVVRYQSVITLLNGEKSTLHQALARAEQVRQKQEEWIRRMQEVLHTLQTEEAALSQDNRTLSLSNCRLDMELGQLRVKVEEAVQEATHAKQANDTLVTNVENLSRQGTAAQAEDRRKLAEEVQLLHKRLERVRDKLKRQDGGYSRDSEVQELNEEITALRNVLNCNVCGNRRKTCIITRCYHLFCNDCVDSNLKARKRKCPQCLTAFSESDVKQVWLS